MHLQSLQCSIQRREQEDDKKSSTGCQQRDNAMAIGRTATSSQACVQPKTVQKACANCKNLNLQNRRSTTQNTMADCWHANTHNVSTSASVLVSSALSTKPPKEKKQRTMEEHCKHLLTESEVVNVKEFIAKFVVNNKLPFHIVDQPIFL